MRIWVEASPPVSRKASQNLARKVSACRNSQDTWRMEHGALHSPMTPPHALGAPGERDTHTHAHACRAHTQHATCPIQQAG